MTHSLYFAQKATASLLSKLDGSLNRCRRGVAAVLGAVALAVVPAAQADLIGLYEFNGDLSNSVVGPDALGDLELDPISSGTREVVDGRLEWSNVSTNSGLNLKLSGVSSGLTEFSIGIVFTLVNENSGYNKILDFENRTNDVGLYKYANALEVYSTYAKTEANYPEGSQVILVLTRTSENFNIFVEGSPGVSDYHASIAMNGTIWFFTDDGGGEFAEAGFIEEIRIWNTALSEEEARAAFSHIPEPSAALLGLGGLLALQRWKRRRS